MRHTICSVTAFAVGMSLAPFSLSADDKQGHGSVFSKDNLVAWCVVPFDAEKRGPEERAEMLNRLGIKRLAYDWREEHIPTFDQEVESLKRHGIKLEAFWCPCGTLNPEKEEHIGVILDLLKRHEIKTQLWVLLNDSALSAFEAGERVEAASRAIGYIAEEAEKIGCSVALYNHGGWFGEPENQIAIINHLKMNNVGIVYNFHHGHEHIDRFASLFAEMQPHLLALNLNGMEKGGPKILPIGEGDRELEMLKIIGKSAYRGPIGILDHQPEVDAELSLKRNLDGLQKLLAKIGDQKALESYQAL